MDRKSYKEGLYKGTVERLERLMQYEGRLLAEKHPTDHGPLMAKGQCQICGWLDAEAEENKIKGPNGISIPEAVKEAMNDLKLALEAVRLMSPEQWFAVTVFIQGTVVGEMEALMRASAMAEIAAAFSSEKGNIIQ